jgi:hypothetical protein
MRAAMIIAIVPMALMQAPSQLSGAWGEGVLDFTAAAFRIATTTAWSCVGRVLKALHDSRRLQAEREIVRHRHLI